MQKNSTLDSCLVLRLLEPQDKSSRMAERITLRGWCLLPADGANACRGEEQLPQIKVIIEEHGGKRTEQSAGLLFFGAEVPLEAAPGCAYLEDFRLTPSERSVVLSAGTLPGVVVDVFGSINISALIPKANECARLFSLALAAEHGGKVSLSNPAVISVFARESWDAPRGGFMSPSHNGDIYSDMIVFDGWAVCPGDAVARVDLLLGKIPCGEASRGISSPLQFGALPDIKEACSCRFSKLVRRSDLSREVLARQELIGTLSVEARVVFKSGREMIIPGPNLNWQPPAQAGEDGAIIGEIESVKRTGCGEVEISGWVLSANLDEPVFVFQAARTEVEFSKASGQVAGLSFSPRPDILQRYPALDYGQPAGFRLTIHPSVFGPYPGYVRMLVQADGAARPFVPGPDKMKDLLAKLINVRQSTSMVECAMRNVLYAAGRAGFRLRSKRTLRPETAARAAERRRLVFCSHNLSAVEGAPKVLLEVVKYMNTRNIKAEDMLVVSPHDGELRDEYSALGVPVRILACLAAAGSDTASYGQAMLEFAVCCRDFAPAMLYANVIDAFWAVDAASRLKLPALWAIHESVDPLSWKADLAPALRLAFLRSLASVPRAVFVAQSTERLFAPYLRAGAAVVIPNAVDTAKINQICGSLPRGEARRIIGAGEHDTVVTVIGTTALRKGQDIFLREMALLKTRMPERSFRFMIVGARKVEFLDVLVAMSKDLGLESEVVFVPETKEVAPYYRASDLMVISSREESAPLVSLEAFAYGVPLVSSTVFGLAEQIDDGINALAFDVNTPGALSRKAQQVLDDPELASRLVEGGRRTVLERYCFDAVLVRYFEEISRLCPARLT